MNKEKIIAASMTGIMTFSGVSSASAETFNHDSIASGDKSIVSKGKMESQNDDFLKKFGVTIDKIAMAESEKTTLDKKVILQIGEKFCIVSDPNISGENNVLKENDTYPEIINNRTMVPLRFISEALGATVDWNGEDQSISIKKGSKEIGMRIGNNIVKVNNNSETTEINSDTSPTINRDGRTLVPVRIIAESFGKTVLWDQNTNTVWIGYTEAEKNSLINTNTNETEISADAVDLESSFRASKFMAGGEFIDVAEEGPFTTKDKQSGAVVVFSDEDLLNIEKKISPIEKKKCSGAELLQLYIDKTVIPKIRKDLNGTNCIYCLNGEAYVFTDENLKQGNKTLIKFDANGNKSTIVNDKAGIFFNGRYAYKEGIGICDFNGTRIIDKYNPQTGKMEELSTPEFTGTLQQRTIYNLEAAYNAKCTNGQGTNPLGLKYEDILKYKEDGNDKNCTSFKEIQVSENLGFICVIGGECGLQNNDNFETVKFLVQECNKIDPKIFQKCIANGLDFLAANESPGNLFSKKGRENWTYTYNIYSYGGTIFFNEKNFPKNVRCAILDGLVQESEGLKYRYHLFEGWISIINNIVIPINEESYKQSERGKIFDEYFSNWDWFNWKKK